MLAQHGLQQHFDKSKQLKKCLPQWPHSKLISPQKVKLRCGIQNVNTQWGTENKATNCLASNFSSECIQGYGWWVCSNFRESSKICLMFNPSSPKINEYTRSMTGIGRPPKWFFTNTWQCGILRVISWLLYYKLID